VQTCVRGYLLSLEHKCKCLKLAIITIFTMSKRKYNYHTVNLPEGLTAKINEAIESGKHGFTSIPDFVKVAVRKYLRELEYLE